MDVDDITEKTGGDSEVAGQPLRKGSIAEGELETILGYPSSYDPVMAFC